MHARFLHKWTHILAKFVQVLYIKVFMESEEHAGHAYAHNLPNLVNQGVQDIYRYRGILFQYLNLPEWKKFESPY